MLLGEDNSLSAFLDMLPRMSPDNRPIPYKA